MGGSRTRTRLVHWLEDVMAGDPVAVGFAVVIGLTLTGLVVLSARQARAARTPTPTPKKKLRWPEDAPPGVSGPPGSPSQS